MGGAKVSVKSCVSPGAMSVAPSKPRVKMGLGSTSTMPATTGSPDSFSKVLTVRLAAPVF